MREALAERLLAEVMGWEPEDIARERPDLQAMAAYKYDEYQQFSPGMRFIESLASWLGQMEPEERKIAYAFAKRQVIFLSRAEIDHFISTAYPDHVRPLLVQRAAQELNADPRHVSRIVSSTAFKVWQRRCLFLGLSDGARTDVFRRYNAAHLSQEQVRQSHELSAERVNSLLSSLREDLKRITGNEDEATCSFSTLVLLDDFSASGLSYVRRKPDDSLAGKIGKLRIALESPEDPLNRLLDPKHREIVLVLYMGTQQAYDHLEDLCSKMWAELGISWRLVIVQLIPPHVRIVRGNGDPMVKVYRGETVPVASASCGATRHAGSRNRSARSAIASTPC